MQGSQISHLKQDSLIHHVHVPISNAFKIMYSLSVICMYGVNYGFSAETGIFRDNYISIMIAMMTSSNGNIAKI